MVDNNTVAIDREIRGAQVGSLLHECTQKIAYRLHLDYPQRDRGENWFEAQGYFGCWIYSSMKSHSIRDFSASQLVQMCLDTGSRGHGNNCDLKYKFAEKIVEDIQGPLSLSF